MGILAAYRVETRAAEAGPRKRSDALLLLLLLASPASLSSPNDLRHPRRDLFHLDQLFPKPLDIIDPQLPQPPQPPKNPHNLLRPLLLPLPRMPVPERDLKFLDALRQSAARILLDKRLEGIEASEGSEEGVTEVERAGEREERGMDLGGVEERKPGRGHLLDVREDAELDVGWEGEEGRTRAVRGRVHGGVVCQGVSGGRDWPLTAKHTLFARGDSWRQEREEGEAEIAGLVVQRVPFAAAQQGSLKGELFKSSLSLLASQNSARKLEANLRRSSLPCLLLLLVPRSCTPHAGDYYE